MKAALLDFVFLSNRSSHDKSEDGKILAEESPRSVVAAYPSGARPCGELSLSAISPVSNHDESDVLPPLLSHTSTFHVYLVVACKGSPAYFTFSERPSATRPVFHTSRPVSSFTVIWYACCATPRSASAVSCQLNRGYATSMPSGWAVVYSTQRPVTPTAAHRLRRKYK